MRVVTDATAVATERASGAVRRGARVGDGAADGNQMTSTRRAKPKCDIATEIRATQSAPRLRLIVVGALALLSALALAALAAALEQKVAVSDVTAGDRLACSVAVDEDTIVGGAPARRRRRER